MRRRAPYLYQISYRLSDAWRQQRRRRLFAAPDDSPAVADDLLCVPHGIGFASLSVAGKAVTRAASVDRSLTVRDGSQGSASADGDRRGEHLGVTMSTTETTVARSGSKLDSP